MGYWLGRMVRICRQFRVANTPDDQWLRRIMVESVRARDTAKS